MLRGQLLLRLLNNEKTHGHRYEMNYTILLHSVRIFFCCYCCCFRAFFFLIVLVHLILFVFFFYWFHSVLFIVYHLRHYILLILKSFFLFLIRHRQHSLILARDWDAHWLQISLDLRILNIEMNLFLSIRLASVCVCVFDFTLLFVGHVVVPFDTSYVILSLLPPLFSNSFSLAFFNFDSIANAFSAHKFRHRIRTLVLPTIEMMITSSVSLSPHFSL